MKTRYLNLFVATIIFSITIVACNPTQKEGDKSSKYEKEKQEVKEEINDLQNDIDDLMTKVGNNTEEDLEETRVELIRELEQKENELDKLSQKIENSTEDKWNDVKTDADQIMNDVSDGVRKARNELAEAIATDEPEE